MEAVKLEEMAAQVEAEKVIKVLVVQVILQVQLHHKEMMDQEVLDNLLIMDQVLEAVLVNLEVVQTQQLVVLVVMVQLVQLLVHQ
jgi:hypothetical protein|tara:strand:+ start:118 stop:372 length:255 start_codon:yes stop_codon:yes gene_type:complete